MITETTRWIWSSQEKQPLNEHSCFRKSFEWEEKRGITHVKISADSRYRLYVNGIEVGDGPIRSFSDQWYFDTYRIDHLLKNGMNVIAVRVWHFGLSNYQYIENQAGLIAEIAAENNGAETLIACTDASWKSLVHPGYRKYTVKRNVNLGWMEDYDASELQEDWTAVDFDDSVWEPSQLVENEPVSTEKLKPRDIPFMANKPIRPDHVALLSEVKPAVGVVSLHLRESLFPQRRDANANIFSALVAVKLKVKEALQCTFSFPHSRWNGVQGDIHMDGQCYEVDAHERKVTIPLNEGTHTMLLEICGIHDDLFVHLEYSSPEQISFISPFKTAGPFESIEPVADGVTPVYGGVEKKTGLNPDHPDLLEMKRRAVESMEESFQNDYQELRDHQVMFNKHVYSLVSNKETIREWPILPGDEAKLQASGEAMVIPKSTNSGDMECIIDLGNIYAGFIEFDIDAAEGTVIDFYGFESMPKGKIEYTEGLNNSLRYRCKEGRQTYKSVVRYGFRYVMITIRHPQQDTLIYDVKMNHQNYPAARSGSFRCSDPLLNDIWDMSRQTHLLCMEDTFVDCPTYEQAYWTGDANVSNLINYFLFGSYELVERCLRLTSYARQQSKLIPALMPTDWQTSIPFWTFNWMISIYQYAEYTDRWEIADSFYEDIKQTLSTYLAFVDEKDLFDISSWNLLDWAPNDISNQGIVTAQQGLLAYCCGIAEKLAERAGDRVQSVYYSDRKEALIKAINKHLWDEKQQAFIDGISRERGRSETCSMQTHVLLYLFDAIDESRQDTVARKVLNPPAQWVQIGSPFMSFYLYEMWQRLGKIDDILHSIRKEWGMMVRHGSKTCWETFPGFHENRLTRSYAHGWSAAPAYIFGKYLLGVEMASPGYRKIRLYLPETELEWAEGSIPTPFGRIECSWSVDESGVSLYLRKPAKIEVDASLVDGKCTLTIENIGE